MIVVIKGKITCSKRFSDQPCESSVGDFIFNYIHQFMVINAVKAFSDISFNYSGCYREAGFYFP